MIEVFSFDEAREAWGRLHDGLRKHGMESAVIETLASYFTPTPDRLGGEIEALCKRVFLAAHGDGWTGNQLRRDAQHIDAEKSWDLYVSNGALRKSVEQTAPDRFGEGYRAGVEASAKCVEEMQTNNVGMVHPIAIAEAKAIRDLHYEVLNAIRNVQPDAEEGA